MTVSKLIKELEKIKSKYPRIEVVVQWSTFENDDYSHSPICEDEIAIQLLPWAVGDNFYLANGEERIKAVLTIGAKK